MRNVVRRAVLVGGLRGALQTGADVTGAAVGPTEGRDSGRGGVVAGSSPSVHGQGGRAMASRTPYQVGTGPRVVALPSTATRSPSL